MQLISHRWLDPLNKNFQYAESSKEAFQNLLERWYWLEFDINFSKDLVPFVFHDKWLTRISNWKEVKLFQNMNRSKIKEYGLPNNCHFTILNDLFQLIEEKQKNWIWSALHLKFQYQGKKLLDILIKIIQDHPKIIEKLFIFDVKIDTAKYLKEKIMNIKLFLSVSHEYDKQRFNNSVWWTLYTKEEAIQNKDLIDWVWLDERDRKDKNWTKKLYTDEVINWFKSLWLKIAIISPELHAKSPWLLWWEFHEDVSIEWRLKDRIKEIKNSQIDYVCTDYLDYYIKNE